jgi:hypothetical protein
MEKTLAERQADENFKEAMEYENDDILKQISTMKMEIITLEKRIQTLEWRTSQ